MRFAAFLLACALCAAVELPPAQWQRTARDLFDQLISANTADSNGATTPAAEAMAKVLRSAGWSESDILIAGPNERRKNLIARFRGTGSALKPVLLLAHLDVVEARRSDWSVDPFHLTEKEGFFYGRGTDDDKAMAANWIANLLRYKQEGFRPKRDLIVALTAGEESGVDNGVEWLLKNKPQWIRAEYAINEGGGARMEKGKRLLVAVQASEKTFVSFHVVATNAGGHSSQPSKDNAIYHVAQGLTRLRDFDFPPRLTEVTQAYFERMSKIEPGALAADMGAASRTPPDPDAVRRLSQNPFFSAQLRTTCVATMISGGHAENALPQTADATVNCRVLPGETVDHVRRTLISVLDDPTLKVEQDKPAVTAPPSALTQDVMQAVQQVTREMWPSVPVVPVMSAGATDGKYLRLAGIPTYGVSGMFNEIGENRAHGRDERIPVASLYESEEFLYRLVRRLAM